MFSAQLSSFFEKKVPFASDKKLLETAIKQLRLSTDLDHNYSSEEINLLTKKMVELKNKLISNALGEQDLDKSQGYRY